MNEMANENLIPISYDNPERPTVSGRELHEFLGVGADYRHWLPRMCEYGFTEGEDFNSVKIDRVQNEGGRMVARTIEDHQLTIPMAKELCMIQRNERGKQARQYFLRIEQMWNSPEAIMQRAMAIANRNLEELKRKIFCLSQENDKLEETVAVQNQQITEMKPKVSYYDVCLQTKDAIAISVIAKDYGWTAARMNKELADRKIQFKQNRIWLLYQKHAEQRYTVTKTSLYSDNSGAEHSSIHTYWTQKGRLFIYDLLKKDGILPLIEKEN